MMRWMLRLAIPALAVWAWRRYRDRQILRRSAKHDVQQDCQQDRQRDRYEDHHYAAERAAHRPHVPPPKAQRFASLLGYGTGRAPSAPGPFLCPFPYERCGPVMGFVRST